MKLLAFSVGGYNITAPGGIQSGNLESAPGNNIIPTLVTLLFVVAIILCLFSLIYAGIKWIISEGKKENVMNAQNQIIWSVIGLAVVFLSIFIVNLVGNFFALSLF